MNINFGLFPNTNTRTEKGRLLKGRERKKALADQARTDLDHWLNAGRVAAE